MIASEGKVICIPLILSLVIFFALTLTTSILWINYFCIINLIFTLFCINFFRDPKRALNRKQLDMVSPADGRVVQIVEILDNDIGRANVISIFLSVFNVHRQWVPFDSEVLDYKYNKGAFLGAFFNKASDRNEQAVTYFQTDFGNYKVKQIAGFIARRIINYMIAGDKKIAGDKLGFIRFGSRVDIIVPQNFSINVSVGQKVRGCQTILGKFDG